MSDLKILEILVAVFIVICLVGFGALFGENRVIRGEMKMYGRLFLELLKRGDKDE